MVDVAKLIKDGEAVLGASDESATLWDRPVDTARIMSTPPPPIRWLVKERIQLGRGGLISGIGGSSKTRFLYHVAVGAAVGCLPWDWEIAAQGKSVLVLTEDTEEDAHRTLFEMASGLALTAEQIDAVIGGVHIYPLAGKDMKLLARDDRGALAKTPHFHNLEATIADMGGVVWVGIDPALSVTEGDELDQNDQRTLGKMADDLAVNTGATCFIAAHSPKGSQLTEELSSHNSRGGGAITDAVRMEYAMRTMTAAEAAKAGITDLEERKRHVQLVATKGNHLRPSAFVPTWLRRVDFGVLSQADVSFGITSGPRDEDMRALEILRELSKTKTAKLEDWQKACEADGILRQQNEETRRKAMGRIKRRLLEAGMISPGFARGIFLPVAEQ